MTTQAERPRLFLTDIAALAGVSYDTIKGYHRRGECNFPPPEPDRIAGQPGRTRPWWKPETIQAWLASRPGSGNYDRSRRRGAVHAPETKPRTRSGQRVTCSLCGKSVELTLSGTIHRHGPHTARCPMTGTYPL